MNKRDEVVKKMKAQLDEMNSQIAEIEASAKQLAGDARKATDEKLNAMRAQAKDANAKMDEIAEAAEEKWESIVQESGRIRDAFVHSFNYLKSQLKK